MRRSLLFVIAALATVVAPLAGCADGSAGAGDGPSTSGRASGGTTPAAAPDAWIPGYVAEMKLEQKVGQLFTPAFDSEAAAKDMIARYHVGGLIYFPGNARTPAQTARLSNALQKSAKVPLLLGIDEEQGLVSRLSYVTNLPGNMALGATGRPEDARAAARITGTELRAVGINENFAPVADVNVDPGNPVIGLRSFGSDPALVSRMLGPAIEGYRSAGVAAVAKHFPGHGDTAVDSHTGLPVIDHSKKEWRRLDAPPFRAAVENGVDGIMSAHIVLPGLDDSGDPATLSKKLLTGLLRGELGYQGVIVTDSLQMAGVRQKYGDAQVAVRAVQAGADRLLMPPNLPQAHAAVVAAVRGGEISQRRLDESVVRILRMKQQRGLFGDTRADPAAAAKTVGSKAHRDAAREIVRRSITLVGNKGGLLPLSGERRVYVSGPHADVLRAALRRAGVRTVDGASDADVVVLTTLDAGAATAGRVAAFGSRPVVVAALGRPYDLGHAGAAKATVATYSAGKASVTALAAMLAGELKPTGKLPVAIRGHKVGHGLTYDR